MKPRSRSRPSSTSASEADLTVPRTRLRRAATVFDDTFSSDGGRSNRSTREDIIFGRENTPQRNDICQPRDDLPQGVLPDSDMLKAIHSYVGRFYKALARRKRMQLNIDNYSMDETALLAFGILLEESAREILGERGDLVFTERADADNVAAKAAGNMDFKKAKRSRRRRSADVGKEDVVAQKGADRHELCITPVSRPSKRHKDNDDDDDDDQDERTCRNEVASGSQEARSTSERRSTKGRRYNDSESELHIEPHQPTRPPEIKSTVGMAVPPQTKKRVTRKPGF